MDAAKHRLEQLACKVSLKIEPARAADIRQFWTAERGVTDPALLHRARRFSGVYPRYRDIKALRTLLKVGLQLHPAGCPGSLTLCAMRPSSQAWDAVISRNVVHSLGCHPGNQVALQHPHVLCVKAHPWSWALPGRPRSSIKLPHYNWTAVTRTVRDSLKQAAEARQPANTGPLPGWHF